MDTRTAATVSAGVGEVVVIPFLANAKAVVRSINEGGMGTVYELVPVASDAPWALKTYRPPVSEQAFIRECKIWTALTRLPNVATVMAFGRWRDQPAIVARWYPRLLTPQCVVEWPASHIAATARDILVVLTAALEELAVLHQDIKPGNLLLDSDNNVKVSDFGIARIADARPPCPTGLRGWDGCLEQTVTNGVVGGTPRYMAPELWSLQAVSSERTDLFSFGVTFYELLTGEHPYQYGEERTCLEVQESRLSTVERRLGPGSRPLIQLVVTCIAIEPADRPASFREALGMLGQSSTRPAKTADQQVAASLVAKVQMLRSEGRFDEALGVLRGVAPDVMDKHRPLILNTLGGLELVQGRADGAAFVFQTAWAALAETKGQYLGRTYADPIINGARLYIRQGDFAQAEMMLNDLMTWASNAEADKFARMYPEVGWLYLYRGEHLAARESLLSTIGGRSADEETIVWLLLALYLSNSLAHEGARLLEWLLSSATGTVQETCVAIIVAKYGDATFARQAASRISEDGLHALREIVVESGLSIGAFRDVRSKECALECLRILDSLTTGGRNHGAI